MGKTATKKQVIPKELIAVSQEAVDGIHEKLGKCYSQEDYKKFQEDVGVIALTTMDSKDGRATIKEHATEAAKTYIEEGKYKTKTFWIPTIIAIVSTLIALATLAVLYVQG